MISLTRVRDILRRAVFNPKTDKRMGYVSSVGSLEYWEVEMKVLLDTLNRQANVDPETLDIETYKETMLRIIQHATLCIDEVERRGSTNA